ncbi:MAG: N-acetylmuramoyl-L-alanine amidase [Ferruginibacter sp.]|nr:N-acetylmuramoyl-L-alanine amidase [Ferruginibacter sp.]
MIRKKLIIPVFISTLCFSLSCFAQTPKLLKTIIVDAGHGGSDVGAVGQYEGSLRSKEKDITLAISKKLVATLQRELPDVKTIPTRTTDIFQNVNEKARIANQYHGDLFICIHADSGPLKTARRKIGTRQVTHYKTSYTGKGKKRKKKITATKVEEPVYQYYKLPLQRSGTSVWIFASHKTSDKLKAIIDNEEDFNIEADDSLSNSVDFNSPEMKPIIAIYAKRFQLKSINMGMLVEEEIAKTGRQTYGLNQRQVGIRVLQSTNMPAILIETGFINNEEDERYLNSEKGQQELADGITEAVKRYKSIVENGNSGNKLPVKENDEKITPATEKYNSRTKNILKRIDVRQPDFKVDLYDDGDVDGDMVTVYYNGKILLSNKKLTEKALTLNLTVDPSRTENELLIYAENEGEIPPNTALMIVTEGSNRTEVRIASDEKKNGVIIFTKQ